MESPPTNREFCPLGDSHALRVFENPGHGNDWITLKLVGVKTNRAAVVRVYRTGAFHGGENKITFQLFSETRGDFFEKFVAYARPEVGAILHRHHAYRVRFNSDAMYPVIESVVEDIG